jgi:hypothetical protein
MFVAAATFATEKNPATTDNTDDVAVVNNAPSKYKVVYLDETKETIQVILRNANGEVLHKDRIQNDGGFAQPYDLSDLPDGDYKFEIKKEDGTTIEKEIKNSTKAQKSFYTSLLEVQDDTYRLAVVNKTASSSPFTVNIYDASGNLIYTDKVKSAEGFRRNYDLSQFNSSSYEFSVTNATGVESKSTK